MSESVFAFDLGDPVPVAVVVDEPRAEPPERPVCDAPHEFREVRYRGLGFTDPDYAACACGQMAKRS